MQALPWLAEELLQEGEHREGLCLSSFPSTTSNTQVEFIFSHVSGKIVFQVTRRLRWKVNSVGEISEQTLENSGEHTGAGHNVLCYSLWEHSPCLAFVSPLIEPGLGERE